MADPATRRRPSASAAAATAYGRADVYDAVYRGGGKDYAAEAARVAAVIRSRNPGARTLLDVACGTGGHLEHLAREFAVTGLEISPAMAAAARRRVPGVVVHEGDMRDLDLRTSGRRRRFDAVTCLFSAIGHVVTLDGLRRAVTAMAAHLAPRGVLVVEPWVLPDAWENDAPPHVDTGTAAGVTVARVIVTHRGDTPDGRPGRLTVLEAHHLVAVDGARASAVPVPPVPTAPDAPSGGSRVVEHLVERYELGLFDRDEYVAAVEAAGLVADLVDGGRGLLVGQRPA